MEKYPCELPTSIDLPAVGESWLVEYRSSGEPHVGVHERRDRLIVRGTVERRDECRQALHRWLKRRAHRTLAPMLLDLSARHGLLAPETVRVGLPRTRWASCSSRRTVSLNARLMFLPERLVRHVMLHELCHLEHLDHSTEFYALLADVDAGYRGACRELKRAHDHVPRWAQEHRPRSPRRSLVGHRRWEARVVGRARS